MLMTSNCGVATTGNNPKLVGADTESRARLSEAFRLVHHWMNQHALKLNASKTVILPIFKDLNFLFTCTPIQIAQFHHHQKLVTLALCLTIIALISVLRFLMGDPQHFTSFGTYRFTKMPFPVTS